MKKIVLFSLMMACLPFMVLAQSGNDDLYFIPKKKAEKKEKETKVVVEKGNTSATANTVSTPVVVKDVKGNVRDVDEYNRRYTSRDNSFSYENDTLYIEEKPYNERGEWINGFEGSQTDYDYAMRLVRFRSPRFAVSVSSPYYWDIISLGYSSDWNVFDTGLYAYAFPTFSNRFWWNWHFDYAWRSPSWYYSSSWYYPSSWWYGWHYPHYHMHHAHWHHFPPHYAHGGVGGYWGNNHGWHGSSAHNPGIHSGRYADNHRRETFPARSPQATRTERNSRNDYVGGRRNSRNEQTTTGGRVVRNSSGRVVTSTNSAASLRTQRSAAKGRGGQAVSGGSTNTRSSGSYTRQTQGRSGSSYNRASSTRSTVTNSGNYSSGRSGGGYYNGGSSSGSSSSRSSVSSGSSRSSSSGSYSSGSGGSSRSSGSGGASRSSGGRR